MKSATKMELKHWRLIAYEYHKYHENTPHHCN